jgi:hypothetical protein
MYSIRLAVTLSWQLREEGENAMSPTILIHRSGKRFQLLNVFNRVPGNSAGQSANGTYVLFSLDDGTIRKVDEKSISNYSVDVKSYKALEPTEQ